MPSFRASFSIGCILLGLLCGGCSNDKDRVNANTKFAAKWVLTDVNGKGLLDLEVDGDKFAAHWVQDEYHYGGYTDPKDPRSTYDGNMKTITRIESDVVYDGQALWQYNFKVAAGDSRQTKAVTHYVPPKGLPKGYPGRFWAIPEEYQLSQLASKTQGGVTYRVYEDRSDMPGHILGYVIHPQGYIKQFNAGTITTRQAGLDVVGHGADTYKGNNGEQITVTYQRVRYTHELLVFEERGKNYECVEYKPLDSPDPEHFKFTSHGEQVKEVSSFGFW